MADNYLEKRMEDMRSGKLGRGVQVTKMKSRTLLRTDTSLSGLRVLIMDLNDGTIGDVIRLFRSVGCRVAFLGSDYKHGQQLAQSTGARFYPFDSADPEDFENKKRSALKYWNGIDIFISGGI